MTDTAVDALNINFGTVDCRNQRYLTWKNGVRTVPTIIVFNPKKGKRVYKGKKNSASLTKWLL